MSLDDLERALEKTLEDRRLSRGERQAFTDLIDEASLDERQRATLRRRAFELAKSRLDREEHRQVIDWLDDALRAIRGTREERPASRPEAFFSPSEACRARIVRLFQSSRARADVCVFTITDDRITDAILDAHLRRVAVRVVTDDEKSEDLGSDIDRLVRAGIPVRVDASEKHMHHKFAVFDERIVVTGSYNWTRSAATQNEENLVVAEDPSLVRSFLGEFEKLWKSLGDG